MRYLRQKIGRRTKIQQFLLRLSIHFWPARDPRPLFRLVWRRESGLTQFRGPWAHCVLSNSLQFNVVWREVFHDVCCYWFTPESVVGWLAWHRRWRHKSKESSFDQVHEPRVMS